MKTITNTRFDEERALYGAQNVLVRDCAFDGPADGESAFKEGRDIQADHCFFNLRYPFWHNTGLKIENSEMTGLCRAALWYSGRVDIRETKLHGIKALREWPRCDHARLRHRIPRIRLVGTEHRHGRLHRRERILYAPLRASGLPECPHEGEVCLPVYRGRGV